MEFGLPFPGDSARPDTNPGAEATIKALYRRLALRLHPDRNPGAAGAHWDALQIAYEAKDVSRMRIIEAVIELEETGMGMHLGLARAAGRSLPAPGALTSPTGRANL